MIVLWWIDLSAFFKFSVKIIDFGLSLDSVIVYLCKLGYNFLIDDSFELSIDWVNVLSLDGIYPLSFSASIFQCYECGFEVSECVWKFLIMSLRFGFEVIDMYKLLW